LHKSALESAIYDKLKKGPEFEEEEIGYTIPRKPLVEEIKQLITPSEAARFYPLIVGEHGTGKTSLIKLAVSYMDKNEPKGVVYVDIPLKCDLEADVSKAMRQALGWSPDPVIDTSECSCSSSLLVLLKAN
jgi:predicted AAA+ superfamily ATPase